MSLAADVWDVVGRLAVWAKAKANEASGKGQMETSGDDDREDVEHCALPGFYSVIAADDKLLLLRRDDGGVTIAAKTERPSGAAAGDRGAWVDDVHLRIRSNMVSARKITGAAPKAVALNGDDCNRNATMITWMGQVEAALNALAPGAVTVYAVNSIADVVATATRLEAD